MTAVVLYGLIVFAWVPSFVDVGAELAARRNPLRRCSYCGCLHLFHRTVFSRHPFAERR